MKKKFYLVSVLLLTLFTTGWILFNGTDDPVEVPEASIDETSYIDDITLDTFIRVYAKEILQNDDYELTAENREEIRKILSVMGEVNIKILKKSIFEGTQQKISDTVKDFVQENFMWEEKILMKQYILEN